MTFSGFYIIFIFLQCNLIEEILRKCLLEKSGEICTEKLYIDDIFIKLNFFKKVQKKLHYLHKR